MPPNLLRDWLPTVIQELDTPWVSDIDIESGSNWSASIGTELAGAKFGIVCVTRGNQDRPWLNFEAGAISKLVGGAVPLLIDFESTSQLTGGPMAALQSRFPNQEGMLKMLIDLNPRLEKRLEPDVIARSLDRGFTEFESQLSEINRKHDALADQDVPKWDLEDKVNELIGLVRGIANQKTRPTIRNVRIGAEPGKSFSPSDYVKMHELLAAARLENLEGAEGILAATLGRELENLINSITPSQLQELESGQDIIAMAIERIRLRQLLDQTLRQEPVLNGEGELRITGVEAG